MLPESFTREGYVSYMEKLTKWAARRYMRLHPILAKQDLEQEAVIPLLAIYDEHAQKPPIELCNLGRIAVLRHLRAVHRHCFDYGEFSSAILDLDQPITEDGKPLADILGAAGIEDIYFWFALDELERTLGDLEREVLSELLAPSKKMLQATQAAYDARRHNAKSGNKSQGNYIQRDRLNSLSVALCTPVHRIRYALNNIQRATLKIFANDFPSGPYKVVSPGSAPYHFTSTPNPKGESRMVMTGNSKGVIPDGPDPLLDEFAKNPPAEGAAAAQKAAKEKKAKTAPATGKAATKPKAKVVTAKKAAVKGKEKEKGKPAKEAKGPRSARGPRVFDPEKPFREGSNADTAWKYLMGVFAKGGKDKVVTGEDAAKAFEKVGKKDAEAAKNGSYFLYWCAKHKLLVRTDRGAYGLPKR